MQIPIPCELGEKLVTGKGEEVLKGVAWFKWSDGIEFTYHFERPDKWTAGHLFSVKEPDYELCYEVCDTLLIDGLLRLKGFPIKGKGYLYGLDLIRGCLFANLILTDCYFAHVYAACDKHGNYIDNGDILVPPSWDTVERKYSIILKQYSNVKVECIT